MSQLSRAWAGIREDQEFLASVYPEFTKRSSLRAILQNPSLRATFLMRIAAQGGTLGHLARSRLLRSFACDVSPGADLRGALHLPHPLGIVVGSGAVVETGVSIYQNVTIGAGRGMYPHIMEGVTIFPNAILAGSIRIGARSRIGAAVYCDHDVAEGATLRNPARGLA